MEKNPIIGKVNMEKSEYGEKSGENGEKKSMDSTIIVVLDTLTFLS